MSLRADKLNLNTQVSRYMTLLSNLSNPPTDYINDLDYFRALVQIANQREIDGLYQTWEAMRPTDARSMKYISTGVLGEGRVVELKSLIDLTFQVMEHRGGPTSGNWGHIGRPGKKGGSKQGGGFVAVGIKPKSPLSRQNVVSASKKERGERKEGVVKQSPKSVAQARETVKKAKVTRDKDLKAARKLQIDDLKEQDRRRILISKIDKSGGKIRALDKKIIELDDERSNLFAKVGPGGTNKTIANRAAVIDRRRARFVKLRDKADNDFSGLQEKGEKIFEAEDKIKARRKKLGSKGSPGAIVEQYQKDTEAASQVLFQDNLNNAKKVRAELKNEARLLDRKVGKLEKDKEKSLSDMQSVVDLANKSNIRAGSEQDKIVLNRINNLSQQAFVAEKEIDRLKRAQLPKNRALLEVANPTRVIAAPGSKKDPQLSAKDGWKKGTDGFSSLVSDDVIPKGVITKFDRTESSRSFHITVGISEVHMADFAGPKTVVHELGHMAEANNPRLLKRSLEWRGQRTKGEKNQKLLDITGNEGYNSAEVSKPDKFISPYIGKDYGSKASEVFSMGIEKMYSDPIGLAKSDPDMFDHIYAQARTP